MRGGSYRTAGASHARKDDSYTMDEKATGEVLCESGGLGEMDESDSCDIFGASTDHGAGGGAADAVGFSKTPSSVVLRSGDVGVHSHNSNGRLIPTAASSLGRRIVRAASESDNSLFFQTRSTAAETKPFISNLVHACVSRDDYTGDLTFTKWSGDAALLFIDISGYSTLAAALPGAHALAEATNGYFEPIVDMILAAKGDVLKFAGDAIMVVWPSSACSSVADCIHTALRCALDLQRTLGTYDVPSSPGTQLQLHIGCAAGRMDAEVLLPSPNASRQKVMQEAFFFFCGPVLHGLQDIVANSPTQCVVVSRLIGSHVPLNTLQTSAEPGSDGRVLIVEDVLVQPPQRSPSTTRSPKSSSRLISPKATFHDGHIIMSESRNSAVLRLSDEGEGGDDNVEEEENFEEDMLSDLTDGALVGQSRHPVDDFFVPPDVLVRLRLGLRTEDMAEMRELVCLFIKKIGSMNITNWFEEVHEVLNAGRCPITQIIEDDKGVHVIASMNLYISEDGAYDAAVRLAQRLVELEINCVVGIAAGLCFCGVVGSKRVHRWDITGAACVRACRVMEFAAESNLPVAVDHSVMKKLNDPSTLRLFKSAVTFKGDSTSDGATPVYTLSTNMDSPLSSIAAINEFIPEVHAAHRDALKRLLVCDRDTICGSALAVGRRMVGKKYLLLSALHETPFVPIVHRTMRGCQRLDVCWTIARWFKYHNNPSLQSLASDIFTAMHLRHTSRAQQLVLLLVRRAVNLGEHVALVIDRTQYIDDATLRLIAECAHMDFTKSTSSRSVTTTHSCTTQSSLSVSHREEFGVGATAATGVVPPGRWLWLFSLSLIPHGQSVRSVQQLANITIPPVHLEKISNDELAALFRGFEFCELSPAVAAVENRVADGLPGVYVRQRKWYAPQWNARLHQLQSARGAAHRHNHLPSLPRAMAGFASLATGSCILGDFVDDLTNDITFRKSSPEILSCHMQVFDVLHHRQQFVLKVLAAIHYRIHGRRWSWEQVCHLAAVFVPRTSPEMLLRDMLVMRELMILEVDDATVGGEVRFVDTSMAEAVFETLTPAQLSQVSLKAIKALFASLDDSNQISDSDLEVLFKLASRVDTKDGRQQRNSFGKQLLRRYLTKHAPGTVPPPGNSLYDSVEHRLALYSERLAIDPAELAVEYPPVLVSVVHNPHPNAASITTSTNTSISSPTAPLDGPIPLSTFALPALSRLPSVAGLSASATAISPSRACASVTTTRRTVSLGNKSKEFSSSTLVSPKRLPHRPLDIADKVILPLSCENVLAAAPTLSLGPLSGMLRLLMLHCINRYILSNGGPNNERISSLPVSGEAYLRLSDKVDAAIQGNGAALESYVSGVDAGAGGRSSSSSVFSNSMQDKERSLVMRLETLWADHKLVAEPTTTGGAASKPASPCDRDLLKEVCTDYLHWCSSVQSSRAQQLDAFAGSLQSVRPTSLDDEVACSDLLRAFNHIAHVSPRSDPTIVADATSKALMALATTNWSSPYPLLAPASLTEAWLHGEITSVGLKAVLFMFIANVCKSPLSLTRESLLV